jgi:8-oxo-dGTP pyrophosphatase MutT (NUDIX family)
VSVPIREAATVVLLRDGAAGLETWLLRRVAKMAFAAGMSVFPGGAVDTEDAVAGQPAAELMSIADQLGTDTDHAGALVCAAIRETFEEVGVLLVRPPVAVAPAESDRVAVEARTRTFTSLLDELRVALDVTAIRPWARWITPEGESRRYDTYFFVAALPAGLTAAAVTGEASHADWIPVSQALAESTTGERPMLPPTVTTLTDIARYGTAAEVLEAAAGRTVTPVQPVLRRDDSGALMVDLGDGRSMRVPNPLGDPAAGQG